MITLLTSITFIVDVVANSISLFLSRPFKQIDCYAALLKLESQITLKQQQQQNVTATAAAVTKLYA